MTMAPDDGPLAELVDEYEVHAHRFIEAIALGQVCDAEFEATCRRLGVKVEDLLLISPLDSVTMPKAGEGNVRH